MSTPRYQTFFNVIVELRSLLRDQQNTKNIKLKVGDSINNNRTITVNQVIRYFYSVGADSIASEIASVYEYLRPVILNARDLSTQRTDSIDFSEFVNVYREYVMNQRHERNTIGRLIGKVG
jgi:hypothetical protein